MPGVSTEVARYRRPAADDKGARRALPHRWTARDAFLRAKRAATVVLRLMLAVR